jgi:O-antigen ligase
MKSYLLKLDGREQGPLTDVQIAQMFADQRVNRSTPCKLEQGAEWRTIDDYMPTLKYGTQLPAPTPVRINAPAVTSASAGRPVTIVGIDIPFLSILKILFKWTSAGLIVLICLLPVFFILWLLLMLVFAGLIGGIMSGLPHR